MGDRAARDEVMTLLVAGGLACVYACFGCALAPCLPYCFGAGVHTLLRLLLSLPLLLLLLLPPVARGSV